MEKQQRDEEKVEAKKRKKMVVENIKCYQWEKLRESNMCDSEYDRIEFISVVREK